MIFNRFYYFLLWIIIPSQAYCDTVWISRHFLPSDGLAYQVVRDIAQAPDGSLWFATWGGGLSHFNGSEWETLNEEKDISDFMTRTLTYDREGNLWVGTTEGIKKFDGKDWALYSIKNVPELKNDSIFTILPRSNGEIWFGMSEGYLYSYDPFKTYSSKWTQIQTPKFFNNRAIRNLIEMEDGSVWVGGYGIYHFDGTDWTQYSIGQRTYCFSKTNDGRILSAASESLFQFDGTKWSVIEEGGKEPRSVATTKDGTIVVGTTMGARICQDGVWSEFSLSKDSSYPYVEGVRCFEDGSIWIGSHNGVYFVRPSDWSYHSPPQFHHQIDGDRLIRSSQKSLRILTQKGEQYELSEGSWKPLQFHPEIEDTSLSAQSYNNNRFIVVTGQDVLEYDPEDLSVVRTVPLPPEMDLTNVYQTSDGALWIYGAEGEGLVYWTGEEWKPFKRKKQRVNERVHFIKETRDGTKWIVFNDAIEPIGKNYPFLDFFTDLRFRGHRITDICVTSDGSIWFATSGEGIVAFKDNRRIKYTSQNGLPNDWILCLYEAADGTIWAGMENSTVASFRDGRWVSFSKKEMFLEGHVTRISEDAEGAMWFVVEPSGLVRYVPSVNPPDTVIDVYPDAIVPKGMAIFSFHGWDAWHATPPNELVFSWRILDRRTQKERLPWTPFRTNVTVNSPPLYPGNYVFEVRAADKERNVDATPARVSFTVEPYFFTKTVFWLPVLTFLLFAIVSLITVYRKHLELRQSEKWLSQAQQIAQIGHWIADYARDQLMGSEEAYRILGVSSKDHNGSFKYFLQFVHPNDRKNLLKTIRETLINCQPFRMECQIVRRDGRTRVVQIQAEIDANVSNIPLRLMGTIQDVTEKRRLEENSRRVQKLEAVGVLAGGIAHDFNNLLTAIFGNLSLIKRSIDTNDKIYQRLLESEKAMQRAHDLTRQLIAFSANSEPDRTICSVAEIVKEAVQSATNQSNIHFLFDFDRELHPITVNQNQFNQMIRNIVINAVQVMPGGGTITVSGSNHSVKSQENEALPKGEYVRISIQDQGEGISPEILPKIFDPYFTTQDNVTQKGLGLGLAICYSIAKQHQGYVEVESEVGAGSTFHIYFPISEDSSL